MKEKEYYNRIKEILSIAFVDYIDRHKADGKMCVSNMECEDIREAFSESDWSRLSRYADKYLNPMCV